SDGALEMIDGQVHCDDLLKRRDAPGCWPRAGPALRVGSSIVMGYKIGAAAARMATHGPAFYYCVVSEPCRSHGVRFRRRVRHRRGYRDAPRPTELQGCFLRYSRRAFEGARVEPRPGAGALSRV